MRSNGLWSKRNLKPAALRRWAVKIVWIGGGAAIVALIFWTGAGSVRLAIETAGWAVGVVLLIRGAAVAASGLGWFALFPSAVRPTALTCVLIRFLREGANSLLPMTQVGGEVIGARALTLRGLPASLSAASIIVDVLLQAVTQLLFAVVGVVTLAKMDRASDIRGVVTLIIAVGAPALLGFYFVQRPEGQRALKMLATRVVGERQWLPFGAIDALYSRLASIYANRLGICVAGSIHMTVWFFGVFEVWLLMCAMGFQAKFSWAVVIESLLQAIRGAAFAMPAALGAQEGGLIALCALFGVPASAAIAMSLIKRVPDVVWGAPSLLGWQMLEGSMLLAGEDEGRSRKT